MNTRSNCAVICKIPLTLFTVLVLSGFAPKPPSDVKMTNYGNGSTVQLGQSASFNDVLKVLTFGGARDKFDCQLDDESTDDECEVCNCFHEGRGESAQGRINISKVVYTRVLERSYPNTVCGVITRKGHFSWFNAGEPQKFRVLNVGMPSVRNCIKTTADSQKYRGTWFATHYHTTSVRPWWLRRKNGSANCRGGEVLGNHIFYPGCDSIYPPGPRATPSNSPARGTSWLIDFFGVKSASANTNPLEKFLKKNKSYKLKSDFSNNVKKLMGDKRNPAIRTGDFNGDGIEDTVALLIKDKKHLMTFFVSHQKGFKALHIRAYNGNMVYLTSIPKSDVKSGLPGKISTDLVQLETYMGPTSAYFIYKNRVVQFKGELN